MKNSYKQVDFENFLWIDLQDPSPEQIAEVAAKYKLEPYQISDAQQVGHLPKIEKLPQYSFIILRAFTAQPKQRITSIVELSSKVAFFRNDQILITLHRVKYPFMEEVSKDFKSSEALMLYFIDKMLYTFEAPEQYLGELIDEMEESIFIKNYRKISLEDLYFQKSHTRLTKKLLVLTQSVIQQIHISDENKMIYQDLQDRMVRHLLMYDEVLESSNNLLNTYLSVHAQKSNDVMKLLTVFSAFFLPLTFIVGVYGMNFKNMPELEWTYGYFIILGIMLAISIVIYFWFKRKNFFN